VALQYKRNDMAFQRGSFRVRGDTVEICSRPPGGPRLADVLFGDEIEEIVRVRPADRPEVRRPESVKIYANSHYVTPRRR
jgi:excinuclease ABC subunit B